MSLDSVFARLFGDDEPTAPGSGWISGVVSVLLGLAALGAVLCFRLPWLLTWPESRARLPLPAVRAAIDLAAGAALLLAVVSAFARRRKSLALAGGGSALAAAAFGAGGVEAGPVVGPFGLSGLGLDWVLLNALVLVALFVPLERGRPLRPEQLVFRREWTTDAVHFLASHLLVGTLSWLTLLPGTALARLALPEVTGRVATLPLGLQFPLVVLVADLAQYAVHRAFHRVPLLWRFHAIHHSSRTMDWLAGSRLHLVDVVVTRGLSFAPIVWLGFSPAAVGAYLVFVSFHAVFIHANVAWRLRALEPFLVTPRLHHWHHAAEPEARDRNFAVHVPLLDRLFGTRYAPGDRWPATYGLGEGAAPVPDTWTGQTLAPFRRS